MLGLGKSLVNVYRVFTSGITIVLHLYIYITFDLLPALPYYDCSMTYRKLILIIAGCSLDLAPDNANTDRFNKSKG